MKSAATPFAKQRRREMRNFATTSARRADGGMPCCSWSRGESRMQERLSRWEGAGAGGPIADSLLRPARGRPAESHYTARFKSLLCTIQMSGKEGKGMGAAQSPSSTVGGARLQRGQVCKTSERLLAIRRKVRSTAGTLLRDGGTGRGAHQKLRFHTLLLSPLGTNRLYCHRQGDP